MVSLFGSTNGDLFKNDVCKVYNIDFEDRDIMKIRNESGYII